MITKKIASYENMQRCELRCVYPKFRTRRDFFLGHGREVLDAKEGQDD
jgi:hypothetical protein